MAKATSLVGLFDQVFVKGNGSFSSWDQLAQSITRELFTSKWAFKELCGSFLVSTNGLRLQCWTRVQGGTTRKIDTKRTAALHRQDILNDFMFDPAKFSCDEVTRLRALYERSVPEAGPNYVRDGSDNEWAVIVRLAEGTIAC